MSESVFFAALTAFTSVTVTMTVTGGGLKTVLAYLCEDRGEGKLAQFSVVTGSGVIGDFVGSGHRHRLVQRLVLSALARSLPDNVDQIILPVSISNILPTLSLVTCKMRSRSRSQRSRRSKIRIN